MLDTRVHHDTVRFRRLQSSGKQEYTQTEYENQHKHKQAETHLPGLRQSESFSRDRNVCVGVKGQKMQNTEQQATNFLYNLHVNQVNILS